MFSFAFDLFTTVAYWFIAFMIFGYLGAWFIGLIGIGLKWLFGVRDGR